MTPARYIWPALFLAAVTGALFALRALRPVDAPTRPPHVVHRARHAPAARYYHVRPGDTLAGVAGRTGVPAARLQKLNPELKPTALFLGQRIRLR